MSELAAVINAVPGLEHKTYLELGTFLGRTYNAVRAKEKTGVDIQAPWRDATVCVCSTDAFFADTPSHRLWDVIFIDAGHAYANVLSDYNHAVEHLAPDGYLFIHDLYPPISSFVSYDYCGDGYKLLAHLRTLPRDFDLYVTHPQEPGGYGLTMLRRPVTVNPPESVAALDYHAFVAQMRGEKLWGLSELSAAVAAGAA